MNNCTFIGRLTRDPELKHTQSNIPVCEIDIAVNRKYANAEGEKEADFLRLIFWRKQAELIAQHFNKGSQIAVQSHVVTRSYETDNGTRYVTEFHVDDFDFIDAKKQEAPRNSNNEFSLKDVATPKPSEDLPF